ncbi:MAG: hypothetical protein J7M25_10670 [Deltaproteobacteria bacterium]|nr:hypothetical protein [Deltaproteobacteria bacterium]
MNRSKSKAVGMFPYDRRNAAVDRLFLEAGLFIAAGMMAACVAKVAPMPGTTVLKAYVQAVEQNRPHDAYQLMDTKYRKRVNERSFVRHWKAYYPELKLDAIRLRKLLADMGKVEKHKKGKKEHAAIQARAMGESKAGQKVILTWSKGCWGVESGAGVQFAGVGPKGTLLSLVHAIQSQDFAAFVRLLSRGRRRALLDAMGSRLIKLKAALSQPVQVNGNRVRFYYGPSYFVELIREDGVWKVVDFN